MNVQYRAGGDPRKLPSLYAGARRLAYWPAGYAVTPAAVAAVVSAYRGKALSRAAVRAAIEHATGEKVSMDYSETYSVQCNTKQVRVFVDEALAVAYARAIGAQHGDVIVEEFSNGSVSRGVVWDNRKLRAEYGL